MNLSIEMPQNAAKIINELERAGFEAYIVGGCVRDAVLGREPGDWDITTSALPQQVKKIFKRTIDTGIQHGTVTVMFGKEGYEVTTYRVDGEYTDHRRPDEVEFTTSLEEDLKRRDFTINAMAYSDSKGVIDIFGGMEDIENRIIRAVGKAEERFDEDALRILRAIRFSGQLDFDIEKATQAAMTDKAKFLKEISSERIHVELEKLLISQHPEKLELAYELGITQYILPEFDKMMETQQHNPHHMYTVGHHSIVAVKQIEASPVCRFAALLHDVGKPDTKSTDSQGIDHFYGHGELGEKQTEKILKRLKFDNDSIKKICKMVLWHDYGLGKTPDKKNFRKSLSKMGADFFPFFIKIKLADIYAQSDFKRDKKLEQVEIFEKMYQEIMEQKDCLTIKDLKVNGKDLMELGVKPGQNMGELLSRLLNFVLENPECNDRNVLSQKVKEWM